MVNQLPPAGWHPDPHGSARYRYWDGRNWTEHFAPMAGETTGADSTRPTGAAHSVAGSEPGRPKRNKTLEAGQRVEIVGHPWRGRVGTVRRKNRLPGVWEIWCDEPDFLGRQLVRVRARDTVRWPGD